MLSELFPTTHDRYRSLPIIGPVLEEYGGWLMKQGDSLDRLHEHFKAAPQLAGQLKRQRVRSLGSLTQVRLRACLPKTAAVDPDLMVLVRQLDRYFETEMCVYRPQPLTSIEARVSEYGAYLQQARGVAHSTSRNHRRTAAEFLTHLGYAKHPTRLGSITAQDLERFVCAVGKRNSRASLQHVVAHLRGFLRYLTARGEVASGLERQIDTPRVYRGEQLPRALPWDTVQALLKTIDRTTPMGRRDYTILLLIATYGLRACDIVRLTLNDVEWRTGRIRIVQQKTRSALCLPLPDDIGTALLDYLRHGRPALGVRRQRVQFRGHATSCRELFLRQRTPTRGLKPTAISMIFQHWVKRSRLTIPSWGVHCLRHSYAAHLLRSGLSLKTIGDLLGHRSLESTSVYIRLGVEALREVALDPPAEITDETRPAVAS